VKKLLIVKPRVEEIKDKQGTVLGFNYHYPKDYNAEHANHVCFNYRNSKKLKGGPPAEGMLIYDASKKEINALLKENGVEEVEYEKANKVGNDWMPKEHVDSRGRRVNVVFDLNKFIKKKEVG